MTVEAKKAEINRNLDAFLKVLPDILGNHRGEYALLRHMAIVGYFPAAIDAQIAGNQRYHDRMFSIQSVDDTPAELGYWSYALDPQTP